MKQKIYVNYKQEGDLLEIRFGKPTISYMKDLGKDVFQRIDRKTGKIRGYTVLNFRKRSEKGLNIALPVKVTVTS